MSCHTWASCSTERASRTALWKSHRRLLSQKRLSPSHITKSTTAASAGTRTSATHLQAALLYVCGVCFPVEGSGALPDHPGVLTGSVITRTPWYHPPAQPAAQGSSEGSFAGRIRKTRLDNGAAAHDAAPLHRKSAIKHALSFEKNHQFQTLHNETGKVHVHAQELRDAG